MLARQLGHHHALALRQRRELAVGCVPNGAHGAVLVAVRRHSHSARLEGLLVAQLGVQITGSIVSWTYHNKGRIAALDH